MIGSLLCDRLNKWKSGVDGILDLWQAAGALQWGSSARSVTTSAESLENGNIRRALRLASDGRYGNALRALGSRGVASYDNVAARDDLIHRHPQNVVPSRCSDVPVSLVVEPSVVLYALCSFPKGTSSTSPGSSALRPQHLLDAVCGSTSPAASECLSNLTRCVNALLAGKLDSRLAPWFCGAPLTALVKGSGAFCPIAVGETLHRLVSKVCCVSVRDSLPSLLLPHGQVGVGIRNGLEAAVHSLRTILATVGSNCELCCLKVDMTNAFNECSQDSFLSRCRFDLPESFSWVQWSYCCIAELRFGLHRIASPTGVQQGDPLGPLLFSLVLIDFLSSVTLPAGLAFQLWYLDDGTLVGTRSSLASFLQMLVQSFGLYPNLSKCEVFWPSGNQSFLEFPSSVTRISLLQEEGAAFLGSPV